jgi:hypothetical protein
MTSNTTNDDRPVAKADPATERPIANKTQPGIGIPTVTDEPDLQARVMARRAELITKLTELKKDLRIEATEFSDRLKAKLSELAHIIKGGVVDGWANLAAATTLKLDHWLDETAHQTVPPKAGQS